MPSDIWSTGGNTSGSVVNGQVTINPGTTQGNKFLFNREQEYYPETLLAKSGEYINRFDDPTYYTA